MSRSRTRGTTPCALALLATLLSCGNGDSTAGEDPADAQAVRDASAVVPPAPVPEAEAEAEAGAEAGTGAEAGHATPTDQGISYDFGLLGPPPSNPYTGERDRRARLALGGGRPGKYFGEVTEGALLEHSFVLTSAGEAPVEIHDASTTCECTTIALFVFDRANERSEPYTFGDPIEPGHGVRLVAQLDTTGRTGDLRARLNVYTNATDGLTQLSISTHIQRFLVAMPKTVALGDLKPGKGKRSTIVVSRSDGEPFALERDPTRDGAVPDGLTIVLRPREVDANGRSKRWIVVIDVAGDANEGGLDHSLYLVSDVPYPAGNRPNAPDGFFRVHIPIQGKVLGAFSHSPSMLSFGRVTSSARIERVLHVSALDRFVDLTRKTVEIRGDGDAPLAWAEHFDVSVAGVPGKPNEIDIRVSLQGLPAGAEGPFRGSVVIVTGSAERPEVVVPFSGACAVPPQ